MTTTCTLLSHTLNQPAQKETNEKNPRDPRYKCQGKPNQTNSYTPSFTTSSSSTSPSRYQSSPFHPPASLHHHHHHHPTLRPAVAHTHTHAHWSHYNHPNSLSPLHCCYAAAARRSSPSAPLTGSAAAEVSLRRHHREGTGCTPRRRRSVGNSPTAQPSQTSTRA